MAVYQVGYRTIKWKWKLTRLSNRSHSEFQSQLSMMEESSYGLLSDISITCLYGKMRIVKQFQINNGEQGVKPVICKTSCDVDCFFRWKWRPWIRILSRDMNGLSKTWPQCCGFYYPVTSIFFKKSICRFCETVTCITYFFTPTPMLSSQPDRRWA